MANKRFKPDSRGPHWLAYDAITGDEPIEFAIDYLKEAYQWLGMVKAADRDSEKALADVNLVLVGLSVALKSEMISLRRKRGRGRPKRSSTDRANLRNAANQLLRDKQRFGYHAAALQARDDFGIDETEIKKWAAHFAAVQPNHQNRLQELKRARQLGGSFEEGEESEMAIYKSAMEVVSRAGDALPSEDQLASIASKHSIEISEFKIWVREARRNALLRTL